MRKSNFETTNNHFEKSHNAENCKKGDPLGFLEIQFVAIFLKVEGGSFGDTIVEISSISQFRTIPPGICTRLENQILPIWNYNILDSKTFFPNWKPFLIFFECFRRE